MRIAANFCILQVVPSSPCWLVGGALAGRMWRFPGLGASPALAMKMLRQAQVQIVQKNG